MTSSRSSFALSLSLSFRPTCFSLLPPSPSSPPKHRAYRVCARARSLARVCAFRLPLSLAQRAFARWRSRESGCSSVCFVRGASEVSLSSCTRSFRACATNGGIVTGVLYSLTRYSVRKTSLGRYRARCECNTRRDARSR